MFRLFELCLLVLFAWCALSCSSDVDCLQMDGYEMVDRDSIVDPNREYLVVLGDLQSYTNNCDWMPLFSHSMNWVRCQNGYSKAFRGVIQTGDLTENNQDWQWANSVAAFKLLKDSLPIICVSGNHDYDWEGIRIKDRSTSKLNKFFRNIQYTQRIFKYYQEGDIENIIVPIVFRHKTVYIIALEFAPRPEVVMWANNVVRSMPNDRFILLTHEFIDNVGERYSSERTFAELQIDGAYTTPEEIWRSLIYPNDNIRAVICGHSAFCDFRSDKNENGSDVSQILFNLQDQPYGGNALVQLWEFDGNEVCVFVYNTMLRHIVPNTVLHFVI